MVVIVFFEGSSVFFHIRKKFRSDLSLKFHSLVYTALLAFCCKFCEASFCLCIKYYRLKPC